MAHIGALTLKSHHAHGFLQRLIAGATEFRKSSRAVSMHCSLESTCENQQNIALAVRTHFCCSVATRCPLEPAVAAAQAAAQSAAQHKLHKRRKLHKQHKTRPKPGLNEASRHTRSPRPLHVDIKTKRKKKRRLTLCTARGEACHRSSTSNGTLQQQPAAPPCSNQAPKHKQQSDSSALQGHPAAAPKCRRASLPIIEVTTPIYIYIYIYK